MSVSARRPHSPAELLDIVVVGQLTRAHFHTRLDELAASMRSDGDYALLFDVLGMSGYEPSVRDEYVSWHKQHRARLRRIAVVTNRTMWRLVVATLGMATGGSTRAFEQLDEARRWLRDG